jgi:hypothetical protein
MKRSGKQADLNTALTKLVAKLDRANQGAYQQVMASRAWEAVAGEATLAHSTGAHLREGEMVILVDSPLWATELSSLAEQYRQALNREIGKESVRAVRFTVSRKVQERQRWEAAETEIESFYTEDKVDPVPLTEEELRQVESSTSAIEDDGLREAVLRATIADLQWKKGIRAHKSR